MKAATLAALIAVSLYVTAGLIASMLVDGIALFIFGGLCLWLAFRGAYAMEEALDD